LSEDESENYSWRLHRGPRHNIEKEAANGNESDLRKDLHRETQRSTEFHREMLLSVELSLFFLSVTL
jgi:hypothetical protein